MIAWKGRSERWSVRLIWFECCVEDWRWRERLMWALYATEPALDTFHACHCPVLIHFASQADELDIL